MSIKHNNMKIQKEYLKENGFRNLSKLKKNDIMKLCFSF